jgi:hypothetical protein
MTLRIILVAALAVAMASPTTPSAAQCLGDFNGDFKVTVDELITAVGNSLNDCRLSGARFVDNRDGTVTDRKTGLVWEKKDNLDGSTNPSDPHDADNLYAWSSSGTAPDGTVFTAFLFGLDGGTSPDGVATSGCFTGHCDWRVPTIEEVAGILDETLGTCGGGVGPCVDPTFGPTQADGYWSATSFARNAGRAWLVDFSSGGMAEGSKAVNFFVRAVRGGL